METLYAQSNTIRELLEMLEEDPENEAIDQTIKMLLMDFEDNAEDYFAGIKQQEAEAEMCKTEKMRLARKQAAKENGAKRMREALKFMMMLAGVRKIKRPLFTISVSERDKAVLNVEPEQIPDEFKKVTVEPRMSDIEKWMKQGNDCDWAHWETVNVLTIR